MHKRLLFFLLLIALQNLHAQHYHAYNGSPYAGVFSMYNNPASTVNAAFKWDVNVLSLQTFMLNGILNVDGLAKDTVSINVTEGISKRYTHIVADVSLLNIRFNINKNNAIAFGLRARTYNHLKTAAFFSADSITTFNGFLHANALNNVQYLQGFTTSDSWFEATFNFSHVLHEDINSKFSAGISLGYMQNISAAFASINKITYVNVPDTGNTYHQLITGGGLSATYSNNYDLAANNNNSAKTFLKNTLSSFNISIGAEWLIKKPNIYEDEPITNTNYDWKIGISIMDIGRNIFQPAQGSFTAGVPKAGLTNTTLEQRFSNIGSLQRLYDSVAVTFTNVTPVADAFSISTPTRLLISADKNFGNHWFVNSQLNINFFSTEPTNKLHTRELNGLTITPRFEKKSIGFYMPVQFTTQGNLLIGSAIKLGPLLFGLHNIGWLFGRVDKLNGGGYLAIHIKPGKEKEPKKKYDCVNVANRF